MSTSPHFVPDNPAPRRRDQRPLHSALSPTAVLIDAALARGWHLGITDGATPPTVVTREEFLAEAAAPAQPGREIVILTGRVSNIVAVELRSTHGCRMGIEDFPKTWTAASPSRTLLLFDCPAGGCPSSQGVLAKGVVVHGDSGFIPLIGRDGWRGFQWHKGLAPGSIDLAGLPWVDQLAINAKSENGGAQ